MTDVNSKDKSNLSISVSVSSEADSIGNTEDQEDAEGQNIVTSHVYLRPTHTSRSLDKETVLRRIRHRKRMDKVRNAVQGVLRLGPVSPKTDNPSAPQLKWVDDPFAAL